MAQAGALIDESLLWIQIDWKTVRRNVRRLQMRIAEAVNENRWNKVSALQYRLKNSLQAKLLAVKRVISNKGKNTPGVDGVIWNTINAKQEAVHSLKRRGYKPQALRRIYIPKKNGKKRPLSIPTMKDRAMQALHKLALAPIAETLADRNSYGFRESRSCHDAIAALFNALAKPNSASWVLEGDIKGCFDNFNHHWLQTHIPMDKHILANWLKSGYVEKNRLYPNHKGTPQGGIISPTLSNMALDGMEDAIHSAVPSRKVRVNFVRYADDFVVSAKSKRLLEMHIKPAIDRFLAERGLELSSEKTVLTHITKGFDFLGQNVRKSGNVLHITPSPSSVLHIIKEVGNLIRKHVSSPISVLITTLNRVLRGWGNYHKYVISSRDFLRIDRYVWSQLWRLLRKRHPNRSRKWLVRKYYKATAKASHLSTSYKCKAGKKTISVIRLSNLHRTRYVKIKADANPYLKEYASYYYERRHKPSSKELGALSAKEYRSG